MKRVLYECPFVPAEWIAAHGLEPVRILPRGRADSGAHPAAIGLCAYARSFAGDALTRRHADAVVVATVCDQLRRITELAPLREGPPLFLMNVPATWQGRAPRELYVSELERLGRFLVGLGGTAPARAELARVMLDHDQRRARLRDARGRLSPRAFAEALARFHERGELELDAPDAAVPSSGVPLALVGAPLLEEHLAVFDLVERFGGTIALDATEGGERTLPGPLDRHALEGDPLAQLAELYFGRIPSAFRRPDTALHRWLGRELRARAIEGILFKRYVGCDLWTAQIEPLRESTGLPVLVLDGDDQGIDGALVSRVQALLEVLA